MKVWLTTHNGHQIRVEGSWFTGERLFVDGELQDEQIGYMTRSRLYGTIRNAELADERVKVSMATPPQTVEETLWVPIRRTCDDRMFA